MNDEDTIAKVKRCLVQNFPAAITRTIVDDYNLIDLIGLRNDTVDCRTDKLSIIVVCDYRSESKWSHKQISDYYTRIIVQSTNTAYDFGIPLGH